MRCIGGTEREGEGESPWIAMSGETGEDREDREADSLAARDAGGIISLLCGQFQLFGYDMMCWYRFAVRFIGC